MGVKESGYAKDVILKDLAIRDWTNRDREQQGVDGISK
jgi:hypothetical protein